jgi:hypothetical protein
MRARNVLVAVSVGQLVAGLAGQVVAVRERRAFDVAILRWRGSPDRVGRDTWLLGTGLSAPVFMLAVQSAATAVLATRHNLGAQRVLGALGAAMMAGYLVEHEFRSVLTPAGLSPTATPVAVTGFGLAAAMAVLGLRPAAEPVSH